MHQKIMLLHWTIETNPILPDYDWLIDAYGRIFGEVTVTENLNDGDVVSDKRPLSIEACNGLLVSNQTYLSNTSLNGCYVTLENVGVQNNSNLAVNSEGGGNNQR